MSTLFNREQMLLAMWIRQGGRFTIIVGSNSVRSDSVEIDFDRPVVIGYEYADDTWVDVDLSSSSALDLLLPRDGAYEHWTEESTGETWVRWRPQPPAPPKSQTESQTESQPALTR
jgi:hypothetical protein